MVHLRCHRRRRVIGTGGGRLDLGQRTASTAPTWEATNKTNSQYAIPPRLGASTYLGLTVFITFPGFGELKLNGGGRCAKCSMLPFDFGPCCFIVTPATTPSPVSTNA